MNAVIRLNEHKAVFANWDYIVDVYKGKALVSRTYTDSILVASSVAAALVPNVNDVTVEV